MGGRFSADALYIAVNGTDIEETKAILDAKPELINQILNTRKTVTALGRAAILGDPEMITLLVERGAEIDMVGESFWTPLMWASRKGHLEAVRLMCSLGAQAGVKNAEGMSAFDLSVVYGCYQVAYYFSTEHEAHPRTAEEYVFYRDNHNTPYVDFEEIIQALNDEIEPSVAPNFIKERPREEVPEDLVYDARETWGHFGKRMFTWEEPPQVSKRTLPTEWHPENRFYGRMMSIVKKKDRNGQRDIQRSQSFGNDEINSNEMAFVRNDGSGVATIHVDQIEVNQDDERAHISPRTHAKTIDVSEVDRT
eukprot:CAMPEP_0115005238 /NCGR_PEP_ID=MMETSP0216-20121206/19734_1 /TAXON_ID=223996 /ORGANISM="Protocruzia adherens, Strain Boccale" /LENGTH=307 /DNA_ID=CAMNT_0002371489 /DNA_START=187 /DNA_END=1110 /DNA_ORIENTATION=+